MLNDPIQVAQGIGHHVADMAWLILNRHHILYWCLISNFSNQYMASKDIPTSETGELQSL